MKTKTWLIGGILAAAGLGNTAWAAVEATSPIPTGTLSFTTPSGNVGPMDSISINVTLKLDANSAPLVVSPQGTVDAADYDNFAGQLPDGFTVSSYGFYFGFTFGGTFSPGGDAGPPYAFNYSTGTALNGVNLQAGDSYTFEFGSYVPSHGPVPAGTYLGNELSIGIGVTDDTQPNPNAPPGSPNGWNIDLAIATACEDCFQRTVVAAIPEPETYAMLLAGLGVMGWVVRRRTRA